MKSDDKAKPPLWVFAGGGTAGHIFPGIAVISALKALGFGNRLLWIGSKKRLDSDIVGSSKIDFKSISTGKLRRSFSLENAVDFFRFVVGIFQCIVLFIKEKPQCVFSKGGYVSVPPALAAFILRIPVFTHESDMTPGLANKILARIARTIFVSYDETLKHLPRQETERCLVTGNPIRPAILEGDNKAARKALGVDATTTFILALGGSQGAAEINTLMASLAARMQSIPELKKQCFILHQTGEAIAQGNDEAGFYQRRGFISSELPGILAAADIVITRSGANTLWECGALGKCLVLIPLRGSGTRGDQVENARYFAQHGAAAILTEDTNMEEKLFALVKEFVRQPESRAAMEKAIRTLVNRDAAQTIARYLVQEMAL